MVTGASGFIGSRLCERLGDSAMGQPVQASVTDSDALERIAGRWDVQTVVHLASKGNVLNPRRGVPSMIDVSIDGTIRLLESVQPTRFLFPSSCSIYGNTGAFPALPNWERVRPISVYGLSKAMTELILREWSEKEGGEVLILRLGNVVGRGAKGLIPYLVGHALRHPTGSQPAMMRGGGTILRDYVPVNYAVDVIQAALASTWSKRYEVFNVGSGIPMTNRRIAEMVQDVLREQGIVLQIKFDPSPAFGESPSAILDCAETAEHFGLKLPDEGAIADAVRESVHSFLAPASMPIRRAAGV